jgi:hypothetical protein
MRSYDTLVEAIEDLKKEGYTYDFNLMDHCISCAEISTSFGPAIEVRTPSKSSPGLGRRC